jgi:hypothetical protein
MSEINHFNFFAFLGGDDWAAEVDSSHVKRIG